MENNTKPEKHTFTFTFCDRDGKDRQVEIKAHNLLEATDIFEKNFGKKTSPPLPKMQANIHICPLSSGDTK